MTTVASLPKNVRVLVERYLERLELPVHDLAITVDRREFERWLGRRVPSSLGGAYVYLQRPGRHAVLINLSRIDLAQPRSLEIVVAEELVHMRDWIDGDRRRHARHGHDRIAVRVARLTGASLYEIRSALLPVKQGPYRYVYTCPGCGQRVKRRRKGRWSCGRCSARFELRITEEIR